MSDEPLYPRCPAAFINTIADEGSKAEAIHWLQRTWDELCAVRAQNAELRVACARYAAEAIAANAKALEKKPGTV